MKRKRFISIAAALCLALTAAPMGVLAQEEGEQVLLEEIQEKPQEEIKEEPQEEIEPAEEEKEEPQEEKEEPQEEKEEPAKEEKEEQQFSAFSLDGIEVYAETADFIGKGTAENPYQIATADDLRKLAEKVNARTSYAGKYFKQTADIDLKGEEWTPIGCVMGAFKGNYNGNGYKIANLKITNGGEKIGLFGLADNATIQNCDVTGEINGINKIGGIVGLVDFTTTIKNCSFKGKVEGREGFIGGIVGLAYNSKIQNCYAVADVTAAEGDAGGIAGGVDGRTTVTNCYYSGKVSASRFAGGIVGNVGNVGNVTSTIGTIQNCVSLAESVTGNRNSANRIVGYSHGATISDCYAWNGTKVNGNTVTNSRLNGTDLTYTGGTLSKQFSEVFATADGEESAWTFTNNKLPTLNGFRGTQSADLPLYMEGTAENPYLITNAADLAFMRGKVNEGDAHYASAYYRQTEDIDLSGSDWTPIGTVGNGESEQEEGGKPFKGTYDGNGHKISKLKITNGGNYSGLFGYTDGATIQNCYVTGEIKGCDYTGGIVGYADYTTITKCSFQGTVEGTGEYIGGIVGYSGVHAGFGSTIQNCYVIGLVKGSKFVGGIAGNVGVSGNMIPHSAIQNCYAVANVTATGTYAGGIAGNVEGSKIQNCVSLAESVTGDSYVNRIAGHRLNAPASGCYAWNGTKVNDKTVTGGEEDNGRGADVYISKGKVVRDVASSESFWEELGFTGANGWYLPTEVNKLPSLREGSYPELGDRPSVDLTIDETPQHFTTRNIGDGFVVTVNENSINGNTMREDILFTKEYRLHGTDAWTETVPNTAGTYDVKITRAADGNINPFVCEINEGLILTRKRSSSSSDDTAPSYTVQFDSNGGSTVAKGKTDANGKIEKPADPVKEGYLFAGWYSDSKLTKKFDFSAKPTANLTLYAKWSENKEIVLTIGSRTVSVFGSDVEYDAAPKIVNDRTMLPIRIVAESLGATVTWNGAQQRVTIQKGEDVILIVIGADTAYVNGEAVRLDAAAFVENGRTYLPLRFVSENLGARVLWNETDKTVTIIKES